MGCSRGVPKSQTFEVMLQYSQSLAPPHSVCSSEYASLLGWVRVEKGVWKSKSPTVWGWRRHLHFLVGDTQFSPYMSCHEASLQWFCLSSLLNEHHSISVFNWDDFRVLHIRSSVGRDQEQIKCLFSKEVNIMKGTACGSSKADVCPLAKRKQ